MTGVRLPEINVCVLSGRVTRDAELFFTQGGTAKLTVPIAVNRRVKDSKSGEWKDDTFFIDCVAWKELAERSKDKAKKGAPIVVEGRIQGRKYEDKSGQQRSVLEVVANRMQFLAMAGSTSGTSEAPAGEGGAAPAGSGDLEEVPF
ncbi:MAG: single-stranded DNA-binding protein [Elusimicrobia bacterium]|nr:single-stranded DNA-binding protein [Elusimicrobiota bacterium]